jgi:peptidoglycan/xylan/chitin deacetylase (PgdA/CDA1 family)
LIGVTPRQSNLPRRTGYPHVPLSFSQRVSLPIIRAMSTLGLLDAYGMLRRRIVKSSACILVYHRVGSSCGFPSDVGLTVPEDFERQIAYLCRRHKLMSLSGLGRAIATGASIPANAAAITFDDGYRDNYVNAYPILKKYGVPATIFLATGHIDNGTPYWWDRIDYAMHASAHEKLELEQLGTYHFKSATERWLAARTIRGRLKDLLENEKNRAIERLVRSLGVDMPATMGREMILSWDEVREMAQNGISFGAHTVNHPTLIGLPLEQARREIVVSQRRIEDNLDQPADTFAYPDGRLGNINDSIKSILRENRFVCAVYATPTRFVSPGTDPYELGRVSPRWNFSTFHLNVSGVYPDLMAMKSRLRRE